MERISESVSGVPKSLVLGVVPRFLAFGGERPFNREG
jgi:hypothetical protein